MARTSVKMKQQSVSVVGFKLDQDLSFVYRIASFLDFAAREFPYQYCPYNLVAKAAFGGSKTPRQNSKEVESVRSAMTRVRKVLRDSHNRELDTQVGIGVRATVDSADTLKTAMPKKVRRLENARLSVVQTADLIDKDSLPNTPEMKPWRDWLNKDLNSVLKTLRDPNFEKNLLPPHQEE